MKTLDLVLKGKYFDMIASGEKKEEYRDNTEFWQRRLCEFDLVSRNSFSSFKKPIGYKSFDTVTFQHGYSKLNECRRVVLEFKGIDIGEPKTKWSDDHKGDVFRIKLGNIISKNF